MSELHVLWTDAEQAGRSFAHQVRPFCHEQWKDGKRLAVHICDVDEAMHVQRLRNYWGYVLRPISEQAVLNGIGATTDGWHLFYKKLILGYEFEAIRLPGSKRKTVRKVLPSVSKLAKNSKKMANYVEQVRAHAATTFGVTFPAMEDDA